MTVGETPVAEAWPEGRGGEQAEGVWQTGRPGDPGARYSAYMEAPVDWIGEIPSHWNVVALKRVAPFVSRGSAPEYAEDETGTPVINQACVYWDGLRLDRVKYDQSPRPARTRKGYLQDGDVLVNSTGTGTLGRAAVFNETGEHIADTHVTIVRLDQTQCDPRYLAYLLATPIYQGFIYTALVSGSTNQIELSREDLRAAPTILPPLDEQRAIAAFLDRETAKIDALIARHEEVKRQLTDLYKAKITELLIFNEYVGHAEKVQHFVEGTAATITEYDMVKTKHLARAPLQYGSNDPWESQDQSWPRYIRITDMTRSGNLRSDSFVSISPGRAAPYILYDGDILLARSGATVGKAFQYKESMGPACYAGYLIKFQPDPDKIYPEFARYVFSSSAYEAWLESVFSKATIQNINAEKYANLKIPCPPLLRQARVLEQLDELSEAISHLQESVSKQIARLQEYRTALISAAVTGQIDVRSRA